MDSRAAFGFSQFAADSLHASGVELLERGQHLAAFSLLARSAQRWEEALTIAPDECREAVRENLATAVGELHQIGAVLIGQDKIDEAYPYLGEALRHHGRAIELAATDTRRADAYLERAEVAYAIGLEFTRARKIDRAQHFFKEAVDDAAAALEVAPTREGRVEGRFIATLAAIGLGQSRKEIGDKWFSVGTLARPRDQANFLRRLTQAAEAHEAGGYTAATIHAEGLARSITITSPGAIAAPDLQTVTLRGDPQNDDRPVPRDSVPGPATTVRWTTSVFQTSSS